MSESDNLARFRAAILQARALPPNLLTQSQKLKLYALFQQSQGPAPTTAPESPSELEMAKWEAWCDVRSLSRAQAMDSYCRILENLSVMLKEAGMSPPTQPMPEGTPAETGVEPSKDNDDNNGGGDDDDSHGENVDDEEDDEEGEDSSLDGDDADVDEMPPPPITPTVWSAGAVTVAAGSKFDMPISVDCPSR